MQCAELIYLENIVSHISEYFPGFIMLLIALLSPNLFIPLKNQYYIYVIDINGTDTFTVKKKVSS